MQASSFLRNVPYTFPIPGIVIGFLLLVVFRAIELLWTWAGSGRQGVRFTILTSMDFSEYDRSFD